MPSEKLTAKRVENAKPKEKAYKLFDGKGIHLEVRPNGAKYWRLAYRYGGKQKRFSLGVYPEISLSAARDNASKARKMLADGIDPSEAKKAVRAEHRLAKRIVKAREQELLRAVANDWIDKQAESWSSAYAERVRGRLERNILKFIGDLHVCEVEPKDILRLLELVEDAGKVDTAHRLRQYMSAIYKFAIAKGVAKYDPAAALVGALKPRRTTNLPAITEPKRVGELLRALEGYSGTVITRAALKLAPLVFVRPGELRRAEWAEFDLEEGLWRIPAWKMKKEVAHIVPLSTQSITILESVLPLTGHKRYVFPGERDENRPMSENTVNAALRRMGFTSEEMCGHGFRSMASTLLNEQGWNSDAIERQLAHMEGNKSRAAYYRAEHLPERQEMMQSWADYLDELKSDTSTLGSLKKG